MHLLSQSDRVPPAVKILIFGIFAVVGLFPIRENNSTPTGLPATDPTWRYPPNESEHLRRSPSIRTNSPSNCGPGRMANHTHHQSPVQLLLNSPGREEKVLPSSTGLQSSTSPTHRRDPTRATRKGKKASSHRRYIDTAFETRAAPRAATTSASLRRAKLHSRGIFPSQKPQL